MLLLIANEAPLGPERRDHALKGSWARYRECHVGGDFLLIYRIDDTDGPSGPSILPAPAPTPSCSNDHREEHSLRIRHLRPDRRTARSNELGMRPMQERAWEK